VLDEDIDRAGRDVEDHVGDVPGCGDAGDLGVELAVAHRAKVRPTGAPPRAERPRLPTRFPEDPFLKILFCSIGPLSVNPNSATRRVAFDDCRCDCSAGFAAAQG
jgi:hypothetical protein